MVESFEMQKFIPESVSIHLLKRWEQTLEDKVFAVFFRPHPQDNAILVARNQLRRRVRFWKLRKLHTTSRTQIAEEARRTERQPG
jgi:hypothetical protein